jgi:hypothetical protein
MMTRSSATPLLGAIAAAMWLAAATASAQTIAKPNAKPDQRGATTAAAKPAQPVKSAQSAKPAKPAVRPASAPTEQGTDYWAINTDLGRYRDMKSIPEPTAPGRTTLQGAPGGTVGFTSGTVRNGQLGDGRAAPGLERYNQEQQSYAGVSLSLTNNNKSFPLPTQLLPSNQW